VTILVVDDNKEYENVLCQALELGGHSVLTATNGEEAFAVLQHFQVDLIVSDIRMPKCTGIQLHEMVRDDWRLRKLPFVYITADAGLRIGTHLNSPDRDFIAAKVPFERLISIINDVSANYMLEVSSKSQPMKDTKSMNSKRESPKNTECT
jgi:CheY-like chemotaxis protein